MAKHKDEANWNGIVLKSTNVTGGSSRGKLVYDGYRYATEGEFLTAQQLDRQGIAFTPDVQFLLGRRNKSRGRKKTPKGTIYVPDFIFDCQAYIWTDPETGEEELIHGIECKGNLRRHKPSGYRKIRHLWEERQINVLLLCTEEIKDMIAGNGFPLVLFEP